MDYREIQSSIRRNLSNIENSNNGTTNFYNILFAEEGSCPKWLVYTYLVFFLFGSCVNLINSFVLLSSKKNGILSIILQISLVDTLLFFVAVLEITNSYHRTWTFSPYTCIFFRGTDVLANTVSLYLVICLNFHVVTYFNQHYSETEKNKNPLTTLNESSSSECLVTRSDTRVLTIDYRKRKQDVSVLFPVILIWIISLSISMPNFILSTMVDVHGTTSCLIVENVYGTILHCLLIVFSTTIPCLLILISLFVMIYKLTQSHRERVETVLTKKSKDIRNLLIFCIVLTLLYMLTSFQRYIFTMNITIKQLYLFGQNDDGHDGHIYQALVHYSGTALRGFVCCFMVPKMRQMISKKFCFCQRQDS